MDCMSCGAMDINSFEENIKYKRLPPSSSLTYEGFINQNYFPINSRETEKRISCETSYSIIKDPLDSNQTVFLNLLVKSKFDGMGNRNKPIDIVVILDISGSMNSSLSGGMSCLNLAKTAIIQLGKMMNEHDKLGLCTFDDRGYDIFEMFEMKKHMDFEAKISPIVTQGGTTLYAGLKQGYDMMIRNMDNSHHKRMIFMTDMNSSNDNQFLGLLKKASEEGIYTSIIGIGMDFNSSYAEVASKIRGANYFSAMKNEHFEEIIIHNFDFNFFPTSFDVLIEFKSGDFLLERCIGTGFKKIKTEEEKRAWQTSTHQLNDSDFRNKVNFMLLYFNRMKKRLPKAVLANYCEYLRYSKKSLAEINTTFPSPLKQDGSTYLMKGGLILLKLIPLQASSSIRRGVISIKYKDENMNQYQENVPFNIEIQLLKEEFGNTSAVLGLNIYYYSKFMRRIMKIHNNEKSNYRMDKNYLNEENLNKIKERLIEFSKISQKHLSGTERDFIEDRKIGLNDKVTTLLSLLK
jgi:hypothetical protein